MGGGWWTDGGSPGFPAGQRGLSYLLSLGTSPRRVQLPMSLPPYSVPEPLSLDSQEVTARSCSAGPPQSGGGRRAGLTREGSGRVVQLLEAEGMLRHLPHFPIPGLHLLLAGGRVSRRRASTALVTWGNRGSEADPIPSPTHPLVFSFPGTCPTTLLL